MKNLEQEQQRRKAFIDRHRGDTKKLSKSTKSYSCSKHAWGKCRVNSDFDGQGRTNSRWSMPKMAPSNWEL